MLLTSLYGAPLAKRVCLAQYSSHIGHDGAVIYYYIVTNSLVNWIKMYSNSAHTNHCSANLAHASKLIKNSDVYSSTISTYTHT